MEKCSPTEAMKRLKRIQAEMEDIRRDDEEGSSVPVLQGRNDRGEYENRDLFEGSYDLQSNRERMEELQKQEREIKMALNRFNSSTYVDDYGITVAEALIQLAQYAAEIKTLATLSQRKKYFTPSMYRTDGVRKCLYNPDTAKLYLDRVKTTYMALQVAIDRVNLNSTIEF